eukprot:TRINITY_DN30593_c0_g1_i2.p2 TRINITY_DN30593_c0_g1~~TRINITY_DN30593_c0_g1_i2.p2  ORF type:complete len:170 (-),score=10.58 TRINITY_DN30593_c0_g1_i2:527-1036(-)
MDSIRGRPGTDHNVHQVWTSTPLVNQVLTDAWDNRSVDHVFLIMVYHDDAWGLVRMSSPPNSLEYGGNEFWGSDYHFLGDNFKVEWLKQCKVPLPDDVKDVADGHMWPDGFNFANHLLQCHNEQHTQRQPQRTHPGNVPYPARLARLERNPRRNQQRHSDVSGQAAAAA